MSVETMIITTHTVTLLAPSIEALSGVANRNVRWDSAAGMVGIRGVILV